MGPSIPTHIRWLEGLVEPTRTGGITKLPVSAVGIAGCVQAHRKDTLRLHQSTTRWYAIHVVWLSYHKLRASQRIPSAQVHYVQWYKRPIWSFAILLAVDDIGHWEWCAALQGFFYWPQRFDLVVVSSPPLELHQLVSWCFWGLLATTYVLHVKSII